jgi:hypothetical protein
MNTEAHILLEALREIKDTVTAAKAAIIKALA